MTTYTTADWWQLDDATAHPRLANFRDLGGLPLRAGGLTRPGVLYRSDAPRPGDEPPAGVEAWPPRVVVNLRSASEPGRSAWTPSVTVHQVPLMAQAAPGNLHTDLAALYQQMLDQVPGRLVTVLRIAAQADGPVLVHCAVGKDGTGVSVAMLLLAAGVRPEAVVADYTRTAANVEAVMHRLRAMGYRMPVGTDLPVELLDAPATAIQAVVDRLEGAPGGVTGWLLGHGADPADLTRWRSRLTVEPSEPATPA